VTVVAGETWEDVLQRLEEDLEAMRGAIADLDAEPARRPAFTPPPGLGPIPQYLARRAIGLAAAYETAVREAEAEAKRVAEELRRLPRGGHEARSTEAARVSYQS
jgi:hypothetical protein